jgi:hypothetical protein
MTVSLNKIVQKKSSSVSNYMLQKRKKTIARDLHMQCLFVTRRLSTMAVETRLIINISRDLGRGGGGEDVRRSGDS